MNTNEFYEFWGEPISTYTESDAIADGYLIDSTVFGARFNGKPVNRVTCGAAKIIGIGEFDDLVVRKHLEYVARNCTFDGTGADAWGIFEADRKLGDEKLWLVYNETGNYTLMLPSEY